MSGRSYDTGHESDPGYIFVIGGTARKGTPKALQEVLVYDIARDEWVRREPIPTARSGGGCVLHNGAIYVIGGTDSDGKLTDAVERYRIRADEWDTLTPMPTPRTRLSRQYVPVDGTVYVAGGYDGADRLALNDAYDLDADSWDTSMADMPVTHTFPVVFDYNGYLWYITGNSDDVTGGHVQRYDPATDEWDGPDEFARHPEHVTDGHGTFVRGEAHFLGGWPTVGEGWRSNTHWLYHFDADRWEFIDTMPERWSHGSVLYDGTHLWRVFGSTAAPPGKAKLHATERMVRWNPDGGAYTDVAGIMEGRMNFAAVHTTTSPPGR